MDERIYHKINLLALIENGSLENYVNEFIELNKWFLEIIESLHESKSKVKYFQSELEGKYIRFGFANQSIIRLSKDSDYVVRNRKIKTIDIFSIYSICRMQFESFIMIHYLFFDKICEDEKEFRYKIYKLHSLIKQSNFPTSLKKNIEIKKDIIKNIELIRKELKVKKFESFMHLVKDPLNPKRARYFDTEKCFEIATLNKGQLDKYWGVLSNHLHSEHIGDRQYHFYRKRRDGLESSTALSIEICMILTSRLIMNLIKEFKGVEIYYNTIPLKAQVYIETLNEISNKV